MRILTVALLFLIPFSFYASARSNSGGLPERVTELEAQVEVLAAALEEAQEILQFVRVETEEMDGLTGPHWIVEGANVHVRSGAGSTQENCWTTDPNFPHCESLTGLGNLIVGYNERRPPRHPGDPPREDRTGSHNLVVGDWHSYASWGGFVAGKQNWVIGPYASVSGGTVNRAVGSLSSISGGYTNTASGKISSVSGGRGNEASGRASSVSGGAGNDASGIDASVSGGLSREAPDEFNWAAGELFEEN